MLRQAYDLFKEEAEKLAGQPPHQNQTPDQSNQRRRGQLRQVRFQHTIPVPMDFAPERTLKTPEKAKRRKIETGKIDCEVIEQTHNCSGYPFKVLCHNEGSNKKDPRRRCYLCKSKTRWKCIKCRFYFCMLSKPSNDREEHLYFEHEKENINSNRQATLIYGKTYFHIAHERGIRKALKPDNKEEEDNSD